MRGPSKSPFPGMDPYLESHWGDVRASLVTYAADAIQPHLPADLRSRIQERSAWMPDEVRLRGGEERSDAAVEIRAAGVGIPVVTAIEFVAPWHKEEGSAREQYFATRARRIAAGVNLVEIDLIRSGKRVFDFPSALIPVESRKPLQMVVHRHLQPQQAEFYSSSIRQRLPVIGIPLRDGDADVALDIQALIEKAYARGAYDDLDYTQDPDPPLTGDDAAWADQLLREQGKRK